MRTQQLPLTKQDSYANAIYNSATRAQQARKGLRKQGIYYMWKNFLNLFEAVQKRLHPLRGDLSKGDVTS